MFKSPSVFSNIFFVVIVPSCYFVFLHQKGQSLCIFSAFIFSILSGDFKCIKRFLKLNIEFISSVFIWSVCFAAFPDQVPVFLFYKHACVKRVVHSWFTNNSQHSESVCMFRTVIIIIGIIRAWLTPPHPLTSLLILQSVQRSQGGATEANKAPLENQLDKL